MSHERAAVLHDDVFWASMIRFLGGCGGGDAQPLAKHPLRRTCGCTGVAQQYHWLRHRAIAKQAKRRNFAIFWFLVVFIVFCRRFARGLKDPKFKIQNSKMRFG